MIDEVMMFENGTVKVTYYNPTMGYHEKEYKKDNWPNSVRRFINKAERENRVMPGGKVTIFLSTDEDPFNPF